MADEQKITPQDLYGPSSPPVPEGVAPPIPVEETPEVPMVQTQNVPPPPPAPKKSFWRGCGLLIVLIGLFGIGIWLSSYLRQFVPNGLIGITPDQQAAVSEPTATPTPANPFADWKSYQVIGSQTRKPIDGVSYKLPPDVLSPICDTTTCMSQGTYLPGGTRFTVAPRGTGQLLADTRGSTITDASGTPFTTSKTTIGVYNATLFTGTATGKTVGGYGFTNMRGYMIEITPTLSLEMNHFVPDGVTADFAADDTLFEQIVGTLTFASPSATTQ